MTKAHERISGMGPEQLCLWSFRLLGDSKINMCSPVLAVILNSDSMYFELHFDWFGLNHNFEWSGMASIHGFSSRELNVFFKNPTAIHIKKVLKFVLFCFLKLRQLMVWPEEHTQTSVHGNAVSITQCVPSRLTTRCHSFCCLKRPVVSQSHWVSSVD